jgi:hypothetical protein
MWKPTALIILIAMGSGACARGTAAPQTSSAPQTSPNTPGELTYTVPTGWVAEKTTSNMRVAQYRLPKAVGDTEDASLVLYYFGKGQGGGTAANIERWVNQMQQPDGPSTKEKAKEETLTVNGLKVTTVDVSGTYSAEMSPGSGEFFNKQGYRLRAAVVETPKGSYYAKLTGPEKTVAQWDQAFRAYVNSFEFK